MHETRTIVIGDVHGCFDELQALLDLIAPVAGDRIIALGDIVDRGPKSERCLEFFRDTPNAVSLMGNHERKHIRSARGQVRPAVSQLLVREELGPRYEGWLEFMATLPRHLELADAILVHGFFDPDVPLEAQRDEVVIGTLTGETYIKRKLPHPWYDHYRGPKPLVVGHHDYQRTGQPVVREGSFYGIDTGCVYGGRLTALILPDFRCLSVPAQRNYWQDKRSELIAPMTTHTSKPPRTARWGPAPAEAERVTASIVNKVREDCAAVERELAAVPGAVDFTPREHAARFAQRVRERPDAKLLFACRSGHLSRETVWRGMPDVLALLRLAQALGIEEETTAEETGMRGSVVQRGDSDGPDGWIVEVAEELPRDGLGL